MLIILIILLLILIIIITMIATTKNCIGGPKPSAVVGKSAVVLCSVPQ